MKEHVQKPGVRKWAGEDLIELQGESLTAIQSLVEPYAPCIIQGCEVSLSDGVYQVAPGIVALKGTAEDGIEYSKIVRFGGYTGSVLPIYLTIKVTPFLRVYADEENKPIAYDYEAESATVEPNDTPYLEINQAGGERLVDTIGISQKLDREGGNASNVKVVSFQTDTATVRTNLEAGSTLKALLGKIWRWFNDLKAMAFKDKVSKSDFDTQLSDDFNNKVDKVSGKGLSAEDFTTALKDKLNGIASGANKYTHPTSAAGAKTSGLYKIATDANGHITAGTAVTKADITALGIPGQDTVYTHPTTAGNKHIPSGGSSGKYLKYSSAGTAQWATPTAADIGALSTSGGTISGDLNINGVIQENGNRVYSPNNKPTPQDIGAPTIVGAGTMSSSGTMSWIVGSGAINHIAGSNTYFITQYGSVAGIVLVTPTTSGHYAHTSKSSGNVYIRLYDSNNNPVEGGFYYMFISWNKL